MIGRPSLPEPTYDHEKPGRPEEDVIQSVLSEFKGRPPAALAQRGPRGIDAMLAVTRTGRYRIAAERVRSEARSRSPSSKSDGKTTVRKEAGTPRIF